MEPLVGPCARARPSPSEARRQKRRCPEAVATHKKSPLQSRKPASPCASSYDSASVTTPSKSVTSINARPGTDL